MSINYIQKCVLNNCHKKTAMENNTCCKSHACVLANIGRKQREIYSSPGKELFQEFLVNTMLDWVNIYYRKEKLRVLNLFGAGFDSELFVKSKDVKELLTVEKNKELWPVVREFLNNHRKTRIYLGELNDCIKRENKGFDVLYFDICEPLSDGFFEVFNALSKIQSLKQRYLLVLSYNLSRKISMLRSTNAFSVSGNYLYEMQKFNAYSHLLEKTLNTSFWENPIEYEYKNGRSNMYCCIAFADKGHKHFQQQLGGETLRYFQDQLLAEVKGE